MFIFFPIKTNNCANIMQQKKCNLLFLNSIGSLLQKIYNVWGFELFLGLNLFFLNVNQKRWWLMVPAMSTLEAMSDFAYVLIYIFNTTLLISTSLLTSGMSWDVIHNNIHCRMEFSMPSLSQFPIEISMTSTFVNKQLRNLQSHLTFPTSTNKI